jgi:ethanolamine utilization protein EutA
VTTLVLSGGVAEYLVAPDNPTPDLGNALAHEFATRAAQAGLSVQPAPERMRATVVGLSQFTTQLSGDTIFASSSAALPVTNMPVVSADLDELRDGRFTRDEVTAALRDALRTAGRDELLDPVALNITWSGRPYFSSLAVLADGIAAAGRSFLPPGPLVVVVSQDCARSLGHVLREAVDGGREVVCVDGLQLGDNDFIDVGSLIQHDSVVPVIVKTLVFPDGGLEVDPATGGFSEASGSILSSTTYARGGS